MRTSKILPQLTALLAGIVPATAQTFVIDWFTVDGGGGTSTGGVYSGTGTIGQPDADGPMTHGPYSLEGGFWSLYALIILGGPLLSVSVSRRMSLSATSRNPTPTT